MFEGVEKDLDLFSLCRELWTRLFLSLAKHYPVHCEREIQQEKGSSRTWKSDNTALAL
jgi:hypothetical protein